MVHSHMGTVYWFPFPLLFSVVLVVYGLNLWVYELHPTSAATQWVTAIIFWCVFVWVIANVILFIKRVFEVPMTVWQRFLGFWDGYFALLHAFSGLFMSFIILDPDTAFQNTHFVNIAYPGSGYDTWFRTVFPVTMGIFNGLGVVVNTFSNSITVIIIGSLVSVTGWLYLGVLLSIVVRAMQPRRHIKMNAV